MIKLTTSTLSWIQPNDTWLTQSQQLNNAQLVANHFKSTWSKEAICALCGNMAHESSLNPDMHEMGYNDSPDRGYGLVQWTPMTKYTDWAASNNLDYHAGDSQLARIDYEVVNNIQWIARSDFGNMSFAQFRANYGGWSIDYLTEAFMRCYERPNWDAGTNSLAGRQSFANLCVTSLDWTGSSYTPSASHVQTVANPQNPSSSTYKVKAGDTLSGIAAKFNTSMSGIAVLNHIKDVNKIYAGQTLAIPNKVNLPPRQAAVTFYTVLRGDNLSTLARKYGTTVNQLCAWNGIKNPDIIKIGQRLRVR